MSVESQNQFEQFGKYILLEKLAMGGMAEVYLAKAPSAGGISKFVAIKRILPQFSENQEFIEMFKDEAKIAINLNHSNVVSIYEFGMEKNQFFLVMDYVEGRNLRQILNKLKKSPQRLNTEQTLYIVKEVAAGLDNAHRCLDGATGRPLNITHRDMSPQNVMISFEGEVKIVDFGIAKAESQLETTRAGTLKGKFGYMSPEQVEGQTVDLRTDIFSLGIVLWELLANDRLFIANNEINTLRKIRDCQIPSLRKINPNIPQELDRIVNKALARDRNLRYQTAAAFHKDLNRFLNRQYPDFSSQDFSVFIKTLFANEILETRKRLINYAQVRFASDEGGKEEKTEVTATITSTTSDPSAENVSKNLPPPPKVDFNNIQLNRTEIMRRNVELKQSNEKPLQTELDARSHPSIRTGTMADYHSTLSTTSTVSQNTGSVTFLGRSSAAKYRNVGNFALLSLFVCGLVFFFKPDLFTDSGTVNSASKNGGEVVTPAPNFVKPQNTVSLMVTSTPSGAEIYVDQNNTRIKTPGVVRVPKGEPVLIEVQKPGFITFKSRYRVDNDGQKVSAVLQREVIGYLDIETDSATAIVYVNGQKLHQTPPIKRYAVPAGARVNVKAIDPLSNTEDEKIVVVDRDQTKYLSLKLRGRKPSSDSPRQRPGQRRR